VSQLRIEIALARKANQFAIGRVGKANGSRECAADDRLRVPTIKSEREMVGTSLRSFAHPTN
jgi:hypothetical protein